MLAAPPSINPAVHGIAAMLDTETTGLDPETDAIVELAVALFVFNRTTGAIGGILESYTGLQDPGRPIPQEATAVNNISDNMVAGEVLDLGTIDRMLGRAEFVVAHNAKFDRAFVEKLPGLHSLARKRWACSREMVDWRGVHGHESRHLVDLCRSHKVQHSAHRALGDVVATIELLGLLAPASGRPFFAEILARMA